MERYRSCLTKSDMGVSKIAFYFFTLKGQSNEIFDVQFFFIIRASLGHWPMGWNIFELFAFFGVYYWAKSVSPQYRILRWVNLPAVSYCGESFESWTFQILFKGTVKRDFRPVLYYSNLPGPLRTGNGLKYFWFWLRFRRVIRVFQDWLRAVS